MIDRQQTELVSGDRHWPLAGVNPHSYPMTHDLP